MRVTKPESVFEYAPFDMLPEVPPALSAPGGIGFVEPEVLPEPTLLLEREPVPTPGVVGFDVTAGFDVTVGDRDMSVLAAGVTGVTGVVGVAVAGAVVFCVVPGAAPGVVEVEGVSAAVVPDVLAGVEEGVVMGVDGGVVAEFCAIAKPAAPATAMAAAELMKN